MNEYIINVLLWLEEHEYINTVIEWVDIFLVILLFTYHLLSANQPEFLKENKKFLESCSFKRLLMWFTFFIVVPFVCYYLFIRQAFQKFNTREFLKDYSYKRKEE